MSSFCVVECSVCSASVCWCVSDEPAAVVDDDDSVDSDVAVAFSTTAS